MLTGQLDYVKLFKTCVRSVMFQAHGVNFVRASHTSLAQNAQQVSRDDFRAKYLIIAV